MVYKWHVDIEITPTTVAAYYFFALFYHYQKYLHLFYLILYFILFYFLFVSHCIPVPTSALALIPITILRTRSTLCWALSMIAPDFG